MFNSFGNILRLTSFGESHGKGIGGVIDGFPAGITIDMDFVQSELDRRRPGQSRITTSRKESDKVEFLSGIFEGKSTGCPIGFIVWNENQHSNDYNNLKEVYRPSHADYTYNVKYGIRDHRGGGRSSARETISRVVAGALAKLALRQLGIRITAYTSQVGPIKLEDNYTAYDLDLIETNPVRCPDPEKAKEMEELIFKIKGEGDTIGGVVACVVKGCPIGLGQPIYGKLQSALAALHVLPELFRRLETDLAPVAGRGDLLHIALGDQIVDLIGRVRLRNAEVLRELGKRRRTHQLNDIGGKCLRCAEAAAAFADRAENAPVAGQTKAAVKLPERLQEHGVPPNYINNFI